MPPSGVYDPEREQERQKSGLPREDSPEFLRQRENLHNPDTKDNQATGDSSDPRELKAKEDSSSQNQKHPDQVGRGHTGAGEEGFSVRRLFKTRKRKLIGLGGGLAVGGIVGFLLFFLPILRLESYFADINRRVFASAESAVQNRMENVMERYMVMRVVHMQACGTKITNECAADYSHMGIMGSTFNAWRDARIEQTMLDRFGIKLESTTGGGQKYKLIDVDGRYGNPGDELTIKDGKLALGKYEGGSNIFGKDWNKFIRESTHWSEVMQRRSIRKYLVRKHGTKFWCLFACKTKDKIDLTVRDAKTRLKLKLVERIIYPFSSKYAFIMDCVINGKTCTGDDLRAHALDRGIDLSDKEIADIEATLADRTGIKISQVVLEGLLSKVLGETIAKQIVGAIPIAGQVYLALVLLDTFNEMDRCVADNCLSKYAADLRMSQYVEYYQVMRSANDEMKAGVLKAAEVGALSDQFGGDHPAEESQVFQTYHPAQQKQQTAQSGVVFAATNSVTQSKKDPYLCANGQPIPAGQLVCPEKRIDQHFTIENIRNNDIVNGISEALNSYDRCYGVEVHGHCAGINPRDWVHPTLQIINRVFAFALGPIVQTFFDLLSHLPGVGDFLNFLKSEVGALIQAFLGKIFPLPVQINSAGREKWDGLQAGGEATASEFGKGGYTADGQAYGLGGRKLSDTEQAAILQNYSAQQQYDDQHSSFFAKLTSPDIPSSFANRFIAFMPSSLGELSNHFRLALAKPFSSLFAFSHPASAAVVPFTGSAFGIPQNGYAVNDPAFTADPSIYTPEYCQALKDSWQAPTSKTEDLLTGIDQYSTTNPCLLEQVVAETGASAFTGDDCLDDSIAAGSCSPTTPPPGDSGTCDSRTSEISQMQEGWQNGTPTQIKLCALTNLPSGGEESTSGSAYYVDGANGKALVNAADSTNFYSLVEAAKAAGIPMSATSTFRTMKHQQDLCAANSQCSSGDYTYVAKPGTSNHQMGFAIDFAMANVGKFNNTHDSCVIVGGRCEAPGDKVWEWLNTNASTFGIKPYVNEYWHWSPTGN